MRKPISPLSLLLITLHLAIASTNAHATSISTILEPFTGDDAEVRVTLNDDAGDGTIEVTAEVIGGFEADLRGLFLDIADDALLSGLTIDGDDVTSVALSGSVINLGRGNNLNGGGSPCPCDIGVEFGSPGIGKDDIDYTSFTISHSTESLSLSLFDDQLLGVRLTSVSVLDEHTSDNREGSSKLYGVVPEPSTAVLVGLGLAVLTAHRRTSGVEHQELAR